MATLATNKNSSVNPVDKKKKKKNIINKSTTKSNAIIINKKGIFQHIIP
jgi:hypothetical protein